MSNIIDPETKAWIDSASYEELLRRWRFASVGDPMFQDATGEYYSKVMFARRSAIGNEAAVAASKRVGWRA